MITVILYIIMIASIILGTLSGINYLAHPLANTRFVKYTGGKFWVTAFVCLIALFLKGHS